MAVRYYQGTVVGQGGEIDEEAVAIKLRKAMEGFGTNEKKIIEVLSTHTNHEIQQIKKHYKTMYGRILAGDFQSELSGHFETLCLYLLLPRIHFKAYCLNKAMRDAGTDETALIEILCTSSNREIEEIKAAYKEKFGRDLERDITGDTSGHFQRVLISLVQGNRNEDPKVDPDLVKVDAKALLDAGVKKIGTDESVFNRILCSRSIPFLQAVFDKYRELRTKDITVDIESETSGNLKEAYLAIARFVMDPLDYFAECFYKTMEGCGTNDERLMQLVVNHCETDLQDIAETYLKKYKVGLSRAIHEDTSGDYRKLMTRLTNIPVNKPTPDMAMLSVTDMDQPQKAQ